jgi:putative transposase
MPRTARTVLPGIPHHVIQRGNRRQDVFFSPEDYRLYLRLLKEQVEKGRLQFAAYCLMRNHVHLVVVPLVADGLRGVGEANRRYARAINKKMEWSGYLWQGRFSSYPMDERYSYEAIRYVELNAVRAGICKHPAEYRWSSARQRIGKESEHDLRIAPLPASQFGVENWEAYWQESLERLEITQEFIDNEHRQKPLGIKLVA